MGHRAANQREQRFKMHLGKIPRAKALHHPHENRAGERRERRGRGIFAVLREERGGGILHPLFIFTHPSCRRCRFFGGGGSNRFERGQHVQPQPVAGTPALGVGGVGHKRLAAGGEICENFLFRGLQHRADEQQFSLPPHGGDAAHPAQSAAAQQVLQQRFQLVVGMVRRQHARHPVFGGKLRKQPIALGARGGLHTFPGFARPCGHIGLPHGKRNVPPRAKRAAEFRIPVRFRTPDAMVHVHRRHRRRGQE